MRVVGVVPAAGHATRLEALPELQGRGWSKEVLRVQGRPVVDHLLERLRAAPVDELRLVTRPDKVDVVAHAQAAGALVVLGAPADVAASLLLGIDGLADDDVVLVGFPDTVWEPADGFARLLAALAPGVDVVLGLFDLDDVRAADEVRRDGDVVTAVVPKPTDPQTLTTWGCAAARVSALRSLTGVGEPGALFDRLARETAGSVVGVHLGSTFVDVGTPLGLERAGGLDEEV